MSSELDDVARALFNGQIPSIWRRLAPETLKSLGNWIVHFENRYKQYAGWVSCHILQIVLYFFFEIYRARVCIYPSLDSLEAVEGTCNLICAGSNISLLFEQAHGKTYN